MLELENIEIPLSYYALLLIYMTVHITYQQIYTYSLSQVIMTFTVRPPQSFMVLLAHIFVNIYYVILTCLHLLLFTLFGKKKKKQVFLTY